jgi:hypothetical protein
MLLTGRAIVTIVGGKLVYRMKRTKSKARPAVLHRGKD